MKKYCLAFLILGGCVTLPKETVVLSGEMQTMIASAKESHMALLDEYEVQRRGRIDEYMESTLIPKFIKSLAKDGDLWGKTCKIANTTDAALELQGFVEAAAQAIFAKRKEFTDALDLTMIDLRAAVRAHYVIMEQSNLSVTSNLRSIRKNDEVMENTLKKLSIDPDKIVPLRHASEKLDKLFKK